MAYLKREIYLDMDGVCCNFLDAALKILGREDLINNWPEEPIGLEQATNISAADMWENYIDPLGSDFWKNLEAFPWFEKLYQGLLQYGPVYFLSKPCLSPNSLKGKIEWLQNVFGKDFRDYILTSQKQLLAKPSAILIDDDDRNCISFINSGGKAILFPQYWNKNRHIIDNLDYVFKNL